ncbi:MAG: hypothetical protein KDC97_13620 [Confluentibacter sp.]|nr:hypothetical protein [Confluentibacter sp.]
MSENIKNKDIKFIFIIIITLILFGAGIFLKIMFDSFELIPKNIADIVNGNIVSKTFYERNLKYPIIELISNMSISFSFAVIISIFFVRSIESREKEEFEDKLLKFQKETAKDAISSSFERLIDRDFFEIIKTDILNAKFHRRKIRWEYDIVISKNNKESMVLTRTVSYILENISQIEQTEDVHVSMFSTVHCTTEGVSIKCKIDGEKNFRDLTINDKNEHGISTSTIQKINIPARKNAEIVSVFKQVFPRDYIYETHFLNNGGTELEITVNLPYGYDFSISSTLASRTEKLLDEPTKKRYRINGAIYKGQGIEFMCFKQPADSISGVDTSS